MTHLVRLCNVNKDPRIPFKASTLYKWRHLNRFPGLFLKVAGAVFIDLDRLGAIAEAGRLGK